MATEVEPTLAELGRTLERIERDIGRRFDEMRAELASSVRTEVYEAHRQAMQAQIAVAVEKVADLREDLDELRDALAAEKKERRADRRIYISALLSLLVVVAGAFLVAAFGLK